MTARPALLCDVETALACVGAYAAPRLTPEGYELLDDARTPDQQGKALREVAAKSLNEGRKENPLQENDPWYRQVAINQEWLITPVDPTIPMQDQLKVWTLLGCETEVQAMHHALLPIVEEFTGTPVVPTACFGPRLYEPGSVLLMHLDRYPTHEIGVSFVCSGPPWDMWLADASLAATGLTGETLSIHQHIIYEGCRILHGRPNPCTADTVVAFFHYHRADASTGDPSETSHDFKP